MREQTCSICQHMHMLATATVLTGAEMAGLRLPDMSLSRDDLERICRPLLERAKKPLSQALAQMNLRPEDINDVVMVGGSSRLDAVRKLVSYHLPGCRSAHDSVRSMRAVGDFWQSLMIPLASPTTSQGQSPMGRQAARQTQTQMDR